MLRIAAFICLLSSSAQAQTCVTPKDIASQMFQSGLNKYRTLENFRSWDEGVPFDLFVSYLGELKGYGFWFRGGCVVDTDSLNKEGVDSFLLQQSHIPDWTFEEGSF